MGTWVEYRLVRSWDGRRKDPLESNYQLTRDRLLPLLSQAAAEHVLVTNYFDPAEPKPEEKDFMRYRVEATNEGHAAIEEALASLKTSGELVGVRKDPWSPEGDARKRLHDTSANLSAGRGADEWILPDGGLIRIPRDRDGWVRAGMWSNRDENEMASDLAAMFVMVGGWSREFIEKFPQRPREPYLLSLTLHLLLNGIACSGPRQGDEPTIRFTPVV